MMNVTEGMDEVSEARSRELLSRHSISLLVDDFPDRGRKYNKVRIGLFHCDDLPDELYAELLKPLDTQDGYLRSAADDSFSAEEVNLLRKYFAEHFFETEFHTEPMAPIKSNQMGCGAIPVGGGTDFYMFTKHDPPPPVPVWGYYDLRHLEPVVVESKNVAGVVPVCRNDQSIPF